MLLPPSQPGPPSQSVPHNITYMTFTLTRCFRLWQAREFLSLLARAVHLVLCSLLISLDLALLCLFCLYSEVVVNWWFIRNFSSIYHILFLDDKFTDFYNDGSIAPCFVALYEWYVNGWVIHHSRVARVTMLQYLKNRSCPTAWSCHSSRRFVHHRILAVCFHLSLFHRYNQMCI